MIPLTFLPLFWQTTSGLFRTSLTWEHTFSGAMCATARPRFRHPAGATVAGPGRRVTAKARVGLCMLRGVVYLLLLGMILNPTLLLQKVLRLLPSLAVLIDTSGSMALPDADGRSRLQQALNYLRSEAAPLARSARGLSD